MTSSTPIIERDSQQVTLGRKDVGWGVPATLVTVEGEVFLEVALNSGPVYFTPCGNCDGSFSGTKSAFMHRYAGQCFQCRGTGYSKRYESVEDIVRIAKRRQADRARRARKEQERLEAMEAERTAWVEANADLAARLAEIAAPFEQDINVAYDAQQAANKRYGDFVTSLAHQSLFRSLTEAQTTAVAEAIAKADERHAEAETKAASQRYFEGDKVVGGTGVVVVRTSVQTQFGLSCLVVIEGTDEFEGITFKAFGSGATLWETAKGDKVSVTASVKDRSEYNGTKQTVLTRAKIAVTEPSAS